MALAAAASLLLLPSTSSAEPGPYPGIPKLENPEGLPEVPGDLNIESWLNAPYNGLASSVRAKQWTRIPLGTLASNIALSSCSPPGGDNPCEFPTPDDLTGFYSQYGIQAFLVSPDGSPEPYGLSTIITTRSLAFGSIPIEVDLQVDQVRDSDGLPIPIRLTTSDYQASSPGMFNDIQVYESGTLRGQVSIVIKDARIDGVDVELLDGCRTTPTEIVATSTPVSVPKAEEFTVDFQTTTAGINGGGLTGEVDIPEFAGCVTAGGDDLSDVFTTTISGSGNTTSLQYGQTTCATEFTGTGFFKPTPPGADTPAEAGCTQFQPAPDQNLDYWAIPLPWDIPDYAPGATAP